MGLTNTASDVTDALDLREVSALVTYAAEHGIDPENTKLLYELGQNALRSAASSLESTQNRSTAELAPIDLRSEILRRYAELAKLTYPVTGRTLLQTAERFQRATRPLKWWALFFLFLAVGNEVLKAWLADIPEPEEGWLLHLLNFRRYGLEYVAPFLWGALGSIAYLMKRLSDIAEERTFDSATSYGWAIRIFLGAMLGGIIQFLYDPEIFTGGESAFKPSAIALGFLTGVGVKVVYGAIEKTIDVLASKLNLEAIRATKTDRAVVQAYLNEQLNKLEKEPEKRKVILALIGDLQIIKP